MRHGSQKFGAADHLLQEFNWASPGTLRPSERFLSYSYD
jgi:hypothetical protein